MRDSPTVQPVSGLCAPAWLYRTLKEESCSLQIHGIKITNQELAGFCRRNHIRKLSLFGSILTPRFRSDSDVDLLVEFEPDHIPGFFALAGMEIELSELLGRKVDIRTPEDLSRYFRDAVLASAVVQYEHD